jgi:carboxylesterase type B
MHYPKLLVVPSILHSVSAAWKVGETVKTTSGQIKGHASDWQPTVSEYLGVPFAKPPVGALRWKAPEAFKSNAAFDAGKFSPDCPANTASIVNNASAINSVKGVVFASLSQYGDEFSEDCLTLNVWTKPQSGEKKKAVLVWIYGGGFALGNTASPSYNGARLAAEYDVTVVSMK